MTPCESWPARLAFTTCRTTVSASSGGVPAATNSARPISVRRSAGIFGIVFSSLMTSAEGGGLDFDPVKALRVVEENLALQAVPNVRAVGQGRNGIGEL